ncbi:IS110 family RNA-guided transposase [Defluviicoccus vanus]|uniref:IS110 family transposase n=1 Tax=Defluviicoccus vanus TaxID=111831 RepID=A0A7H1MZ50_9PROT|nr:IS110 family transposase [Defluviicoccus vanus]QNT68736.1 IS110 family transposase [Defluviicoccus vanus]
MGEVTTIGLDIAKSVFQVHGVDADGQVVLRQRLTRARVLPFFRKQPACRVGIEACATAHHWARELLTLGHDVRLMPPAYVKPYVKRQKNDAADAEAICEAVGRPTMRFVPVKTVEQQSVMMLHRVRLMLTRQRTQVGNAIRAHLAELGIVAPVGRKGLASLLAIIADETDARLPAAMRCCLAMLAEQLQLLSVQIQENDRAIRETIRTSEVARRLMAIPGVGPLLASALVASIADPATFKSGRNLAAWIGLVPKQNSSGGKERLGSISKQGNRYLRQLLVVGALAVIRQAQRYGSKRAWLIGLMGRRATRVAAVALANKTARMAWAIMTSGESYREPKAATA